MEIERDTNFHSTQLRMEMERLATNFHSTQLRMEIERDWLLNFTQLSSITLTFTQLSTEWKLREIGY